jgi:hypothetical protein
MEPICFSELVTDYHPTKVLISNMATPVASHMFITASSDVLGLKMQAVPAPETFVPHPATFSCSCNMAAKPRRTLRPLRVVVSPHPLKMTRWPSIVLCWWGERGTRPASVVELWEWRLTRCWIVSEVVSIRSCYQVRNFVHC